MTDRTTEVEAAEPTKPESEFGKGLTYCLGLFLAHAERDWAEGTWFNASSDHFYELVIPESLSEELRDRLTCLRSRCLSWGHGFGPDEPATKEDKAWAIQEAKDLLRLIDQHFGIATVKGSWE